MKVFTPTSLNLSFSKGVVGSQEAGQRLLGLLRGSVLALACVGNFLQERKTPEDWDNVAATLQARLNDADGIPEGYASTPFAVFDLVFGELPEPSKRIMLALDYFRAGVAIPFALVKLAVEVDIGKEEVKADFFLYDMQKVVAANLLEEYGEERFVKASQGRKGYRLLDLVAMWLTQRRQQEGGRGPFWEAQAQPTQQGRLLAAFLTTFGKDTCTSDVAQQAAAFLKQQGVLESDDYCADPSLSEKRFRTAELACRIGHGLGEVTVLAQVLACRGDTKRMLGEYDEALRDLDRADGLEPNIALTVAIRGATKWLLNKPVEALRDLDRADGLKPEDPFTLAVRGATKCMLGNLEEALQDLDRADSLEPDNVFTRGVRGQTKWMLGMRGEALYDMAWAKHLGAVTVLSCFDDFGKMQQELSGRLILGSIESWSSEDSQESLAAA
jgi:tetratricopeptide (TPR) repeat protein